MQADVSRVKFSGAMLFVICVAQPCVAQEPAPKASPSATVARVDALWQQTIQGTLEFQNEVNDQPAINSYWGDLAHDAGLLYRDRIATSPDMQVKMKTFVSKFGKDGARADMIWLIAASPDSFGYCGEWEPAMRHNKKREALCEAIVKRCLTDGEFLERYYRATLWSGKLTGYDSGSGTSRQKHVLPMSFRLTQRSYAMQEHGAPWWNTRNALMLIRSVSPAEEVGELKIQDIRERLVELSSQIVGDEPCRLVPVKDDLRWRLTLPKDVDEDEAIYPEVVELKLPEMPFPKWKGTPPPSPDAFW